jgi:dihydrodipicolinate synthase/N-acetylneuraminate lyase
VTAALTQVSAHLTSGERVHHDRTHARVDVANLPAPDNGFPKRREDELARYYDAIVAATDLPLIVQDASGYVHPPVPVTTCCSRHMRPGPPTRPPSGIIR